MLPRREALFAACKKARGIKKKKKKVNARGRRKKIDWELAGKEDGNVPLI